MEGHDVPQFELIAKKAAHGYDLIFETIVNQARPTARCIRDSIIPR